MTSRRRRLLCNVASKGPANNEDTAGAATQSGPSGRIRHLLDRLYAGSANNIVTSHLVPSRSSTGRTASPPPLQNRTVVVTTHPQPQHVQYNALSQPDLLQDFPSASNHPVLELVKQRVAEGSAPGQRRDGFKLGLVVEGGGMRGIVTGAMLMGLLELGTSDAFDAVYGASAGAINATYFLAGQREGLDIYTDHLATSDDFLSLRRYWSTEPVMNIDFLIDHVMNKLVPLDWQGVLSSRLPLKVVASSLDSLRAELLSDFRDQADLVACLKATARVPQIAGPPLEHRGHRLVDAAVFEPIPVKSALADGCTHVLVLCSRPPHLGPAWGKLLRRAMTSAVKRVMLSPPYMRQAWAVEPLHAYHEGHHVEEVLAAQHSLLCGAGSGGSGRRRRGGVVGTAALLSADAGSASSSRKSSSSGGSEPSSGDSSGSGGSASAARSIGSATSSLGGHVFPVYPGSAAAFQPISTNVRALMAGRMEGFRAVSAVLAPVLRGL